MNEPRVYGSLEMTYNDYLKVPELLSLQQRQSEPPHHDELLFIIIHQAYELWFKLIIHELDSAMAHMKRLEVLRARHFIHRCVEVMKVLVHQIHILETMQPVEFLEFRDRLTPASGFQSMQFREVEFMTGLKEPRYLQFFKNRPDLQAILQARLDAPDLRSNFYDLLQGLGFDIPTGASEKERAGDEAVCEKIMQALVILYRKPQENLPLYLLTESLVELDQYLGLWREHHVRVVERVIGFKKGTGGSSGVEYLRATTTKKSFPLVWEVRTRL
ncbi:MAG: tryptophan 2,3-dioxygenase [Oligoflexia bacterium]|jgi:tryptophan 2,3-dioxygenase